MQSVRRIILASLLAVLLLPPAAGAGGWWSSIEIDRTTVAAGQPLEARAAVLFRSIQAADEATDGTFFVYALQGLDHSMVERAMSRPIDDDWWSLGDAEAVQLAPLVVRISEGGRGRARASFAMPELAPGSYTLMFCDAGCARSLGDVVPTTGFSVVADPVTARLVAQTDRLQAVVRRQKRSLAIARAAARKARRTATETSSTLDAVEERLGAVRRLVREDQTSGSSTLSFAGWLVGGVLLGIVLLVLVDRRSRRRTPLALGGWLPSDEELSHLIASERADAPHSVPPR